ncbi:MAG: hypothetical protein HKO62_00925 [Gammaproteobacteria bacterium]|nr:hypothetical protein [Gammaproteobacteria bacterium]NNL99279.1 hypothetical protein [Gammaproteobacteria bacterium]
MRTGTPVVKRALQRIKLAHTLIWAFFAGCIIAIPVLGWVGRYGTAALLAGIVLIEVLVLLCNRWQCPLTGLAGRHTEDRRANFDIYLPEWLARNNKLVFGTLYIAGMLVTLAGWLGWLH